MRYLLLHGVLMIGDVIIIIRYDGIGEANIICGDAICEV